MARENLNLYEITSDPEVLRRELIRLQQDFDAHTHDGVNSRSFQTLIAETLVGRTAIIGGYRLFEATVGADSADYETVAAALNAGKKRIFVRNGTYSSEPEWNITNANTIIIGESLGGVQITFASSANSRGIYINANRATLENLQLTAYSATAHDLFVFGSSASKPTLRNLVCAAVYGDIFDGSPNSSLHGLFDTIQISLTSVTDVSVARGFFTVIDSVVFNCLFQMNFNSSGYNPVDTCAKTHFIGCFFTMDDSQANEFTINSSQNCFFSECYFRVYQLKCNADFNSCFIESNGQTPSGYLVQISTAFLKFNANRISGANSINMFNISAANIMANNNIFDGGKNMVFEPSGASILGIMFCNNEWVSSYTTAAIDLRLGSVGHVTDNANVAYNIIRNNSNSFTPTITNNSANCNVTGNQLIKG